MRSNAAAAWDKGIATAALAALAAKSQGFPDQRLWTDITDRLPFLVPALLVIAAVFTLGPFAARAQRSLVSRRTQLEREVFVQFGKMIREADRVINGFEFEDLGLHAWQVKRSWWPLGKSRLRRVATYRLGGNVVLRRFEPRCGEGVVGMCWDRDAEAAFNVEALAIAATTEAGFNAERAAKGEPAVMGLTWKEFERVRHRGAVFASPIRDGNHNFRGCLSLDTKSGYAALAASRVPELLNELALRMQAHGFDEM
ncbi:hypothetical protein GFY24_17980 [Nocardia sp. SYP-A9097]|uniref:hypothetical protein n=1 Tax=Nocardia sp. SYP-A9097 TaxID=2663237 RepID=UPI00129A40A4|nr:hypothetical protein [Nocardia sp. SYP-A9097]MRH89315.1 hypothetical protein [Nocardia sp. SYP-A9097]